MSASHFSSPGSVSGLIASAGHSGSQTPQSMHSSGMDDEHVLAFIETVDRADFDAVHVFALDAVLGDDVGHRSVLTRIGG